MHFNKFLKVGLLATFVPVIGSVHAEIIINGTRAVYPSDAREITIQLNKKRD